MLHRSLLAFLRCSDIMCIQPEVIMLILLSGLSGAAMRVVRVVVQVLSVLTSIANKLDPRGVIK